MHAACARLLAALPLSFSVREFMRVGVLCVPPVRHVTLLASFFLLEGLASVRAGAKGKRLMQGGLGRSSGNDWGFWRHTMVLMWCGEWKERNASLTVASAEERRKSEKIQVCPCGGLCSKGP